MKSSQFFLMILALFGVCNAWAQHPVQQFKELHRVLGVWEMKQGNLVVREEWKRTNDTLLEGNTFSLHAGAWKQLEHVQLNLDGDTIRYIPGVFDQNNGKPVSFTLISGSYGRFVFENKDHDFPQQIIYHFVATDTLHASISGITKKQGIRTIDFNYKRAKE